MLKLVTVLALLAGILALPAVAKAQAPDSSCTTAFLGFMLFGRDEQAQDHAAAVTENLGPAPPPPPMAEPEPMPAIPIPPQTEQTLCPSVVLFADDARAADICRLAEGDDDELACERAWAWRVITEQAR